MTKQEFRQWAEEEVRVLDGATGTELHKQGMPQGICPEKWALENPESLIEIQKKYVESGSDIVYTCTFGANGLKLKEFGIERVVDYNRELAKLSKKATAGKALVAGDIAPTGQLMAPFGMCSFEEIVQVYKRQVQGLLEGGVDLFIIETMMDIQEARAALLAVKESCALPVMVTMTFEDGGHTIHGTSPLTALITLQSLGADAVGCNCSTGPKEMLRIIRELKPYAKVPLIAKPNAGLPKLVDGKTLFDMNADGFASYVQDFVDAGVNFIGGCCGTTPEFIRSVSVMGKGIKCCETKSSNLTPALSSYRDTVFINDDYPLHYIGERINPKQNVALCEEIRNGNMDLVTEYAFEQMDEGALILKVNASAPDIDEVSILTEMVSTLSTMVQVPLLLESSSPEALESALRIYPGRALINTVSCEADKLSRILPVAAKYGAAIVLPPLEGKGMNDTVEISDDIIRKAYREAQKYGYTKSDIFVDGSKLHYRA